MSFKKSISMLLSVALFAVSFAKSTSNYKDRHSLLQSHLKGSKKNILGAYKDRHSLLQSHLKGSKKNIRGAASLTGITKLTSKSSGSYSPSGWVALSYYYNSTTCDGLPAAGILYIPMGVCAPEYVFDNDDDDGVIGSRFDTVQDQGSNLVLTTLYYTNTDCSGSPVDTYTYNYSKTCTYDPYYGDIDLWTLAQYFPGSSVPNSPYLQGVNVNWCLDSSCNEAIFSYAVNPTYCFECGIYIFDPPSCNASTWYTVQSVNGVPLDSFYADAQCTASTGISPATVNCSPNPDKDYDYWSNYYSVLPSV